MISKEHITERVLKLSVGAEGSVLPERAYGTGNEKGESKKVT